MSIPKTKLRARKVMTLDDYDIIHYSNKNKAQSLYSMAKKYKIALGNLSSIMIRCKIKGRDYPYQLKNL